jgi:hypothetical protein
MQQAREQLLGSAEASNSGGSSSSSSSGPLVCAAGPLPLFAQSAVQLSAIVQRCTNAQLRPTPSAPGCVSLWVCPARFPTLCVRARLLLLSLQPGCCLLGLSCWIRMQ